MANMHEANTVDVDEANTVDVNEANISNVDEAYKYARFVLNKSEGEKELLATINKSVKFMKLNFIQGAE